MNKYTPEQASLTKLAWEGSAASKEPTAADLESVSGRAKAKNPMKYCVPLSVTRKQ